MEAKQQLSHLIIEGMKHCGKSTHGQYIATVLNWPFFDTDELMIDGFERQFINRPTIRELYLFLGEDEFEKFEAQIIKGLYEKLLNIDKRCVIALGGRAPTIEVNRPFLSALGKIVYLKVPSDILFARSTRRGNVPFLDPKRPRAHFDEIYAHREDAYMDCADVVVELKDESISEAQRQIMSQIQNTLYTWLK